MIIGRNRQAHLAACVAAAAYLGGCAPEPSSHVQRELAVQKFAGSQMQGSQMQGSQMQGSQMQGSQMQGSQMQGHELGGMTLEGSALENVRVVEGGLVAERVDTVTGARTHLQGTQLVGTLLHAQVVDSSTSPATTHRLEFRIAAVTPELPAYAGAADTWLYSVEQYVPETDTWSNICPADADGNTVAIAVGAIFDGSGARVESTTQFTFACTIGAIAKCYRWGYKPWLSYPEHPKSMADMHWACTRMARADYCGDGTSHTVDGTLINVWDTLPAPGPFQTYEKVDGMVFEAGWATSGAVCLSKERWMTVPEKVRVSCPDRLIPPGIAVEEQVTICQNELDAHTYDTTVHLFNESMPNLR